MTVKASIMLKDFYFKYMLSFWTLYLPRNPEKMHVRNISFNIQHIRIISEGSCDWSGDAENSAFQTQEYNT